MNYDNRNDRIIPLDQLDDYQVAEGDPDVRGWEVLGADGARVGEVQQLLVDVAAEKVRYLDVELDNSILSAGENSHLLVPIGYARLDEDADQLFVDGLNIDSISTLPVYADNTFDSSHSHRIFERTDSFETRDTFLGREGRFQGQETMHGSGSMIDGEERLTLSEEELTVGKMERRAGEVEIYKDIETEHVTRSVPVSHEEVIVERRPATGMRANARIEEDEIHIPLSEEQLVVEKRTVPKEELVVSKREVIENEVVEADLRRERADIHADEGVNLRDSGRSREDGML